MMTEQVWAPGLHPVPGQKQTLARLVQGPEFKPSIEKKKKQKQTKTLLKQYEETLSQNK
jgi:hypothetical protein